MEQDERTFQTDWKRATLFWAEHKEDSSRRERLDDQTDSLQLHCLSDFLQVTQGLVHQHGEQIARTLIKYTSRTIRAEIEAWAADPDLDLRAEARLTVARIHLAYTVLFGQPSVDMVIDDEDK